MLSLLIYKRGWLQADDSAFFLLKCECIVLISQGIHIMMRHIWLCNVFVDSCGHIDGSPEHILHSPEEDIIGAVSTGYLEDALIEFSVKSKRRRLSFNAEDKPTNHFDNHQVYIITSFFR